MNLHKNKYKQHFWIWVCETKFYFQIKIRLQYLSVNQSCNAQILEVHTTQTKGITFWNKIYCMYYNTRPIKWRRKENLWKFYNGKINMHIRFDIRSHILYKTLMWLMILRITIGFDYLDYHFLVHLRFQRDNLFALQTPCTITLKECLLWL
jgi:hypothetical protein